MTTAPSFPHFSATNGSSSSPSDTYAPPPPPSRRDLPAVDPPTCGAASASASDSTRNTVGSRVSGLFNAIHGAGEAIRGTINSGLDGLGDGVRREWSPSPLLVSSGLAASVLPLRAVTGPLDFVMTLLSLH